MQIISNGKLRSVEHRAVTNTSEARTTIVTFIEPLSDSIIEPAKGLINEGNPPIYRPLEYKDFLNNYIVNNGNTDKILGPYRLQE